MKSDTASQVELNFEEMAIHICRRPSMYVCETRYRSVCVYLMGFDHARDSGPLLGFHQWLVVRFGGADNLWWPGIVQLLLDAPEDTPPTEEQLLEYLAKMFSEFFEYRRSNGVTKIFHDYAKWLLRHKWYEGPLRKK